LRKANQLRKSIIPGKAGGGVLARCLGVSPTFLVKVEILFPVRAQVFPLPIVRPEDRKIRVLGEGQGLLRLDDPHPLLAAFPFSLDTGQAIEKAIQVIKYE
jgi:hypothetical protein